MYPVVQNRVDGIVQTYWCKKSRGVMRMDFNNLLKSDVELWTECGHVIAKSKSTGVVTSGHDTIEAVNHLKEAVDVFLGR